ncbi:MAG: ribonuclease III domain-containing protein, partial [Synechococcales cyanobacterium]
VSQVRAESQAQQLQALEVHLTPDEKDMVRRGRNASSSGPKRIDSKVYQQSTGLETLVGYLYLTNPDRLSQLFSYLELPPP